MNEKMNNLENNDIIYLKQKIRNLEIENLKLKEKLSKYEDIDTNLDIKPYSEVENNLNINEQIQKICEMINSHRIESEGKCWLFGIKDLVFDYGEIWSSPSYWDQLIKSNKVDENFCLLSFKFQKNQETCEKCSFNVDKLNELYDYFLDNLREIFKII